MTKREEIVGSICDLSGYSPDEFDNYTIKEILETMTRDEIKQLNEYAGLNLKLSQSTWQN